MKRWDDVTANHASAQAVYQEAMKAWEAVKGKGADGADLPKPKPPPDPMFLHRASGLYNGSIAPLAGLAMRGAIWYQGETNDSRGYQYRTLFKALIRDWRRAWGGRDFPFLFVQMPNVLPPDPEPVNSEWAELRESQALALSLPRTGMAVTIDIGEEKDVHPKNKREVGHRLALVARATVYGERDAVFAGPTYDRMQVEAGKAKILFRNVAGGLVCKGDRLRTFALAGADRKYVWADAAIVGDAVVVSSDKVPSPVAVRYAWANNPAGCNLYNAAGLPAVPFRTDDWPEKTRDATALFIDR
jgi:sialate O-acetylesterase